MLVWAASPSYLNAVPCAAPQDKTVKSGSDDKCRRYIGKKVDK